MDQSNIQEKVQQVEPQTDEVQDGGAFAVVRVVKPNNSIQTEIIDDILSSSIKDKDEKVEKVEGDVVDDKKKQMVLYEIKSQQNTDKKLSVLEDKKPKDVKGVEDDVEILSVMDDEIEYDNCSSDTSSCSGDFDNFEERIVEDKYPNIIDSDLYFAIKKAMGGLMISKSGESIIDVMSDINKKLDRLIELQVENAPVAKPKKVTKKKKVIKGGDGTVYQEIDPSKLVVHSNFDNKNIQTDDEIEDDEEEVQEIKSFEQVKSETVQSVQPVQSVQNAQPEIKNNSYVNQVKEIQIIPNSSHSQSTFQ